MGTLRGFDLVSYGCNVYVETGTGMCLTLNKAVNSGCFRSIHTVDLDAEIADNAQERFPFVDVQNKRSVEAIEYWLANVLKQKDKVLFFLDAHFPGADFKGAQYNVNAPDATPLQEELTLIHKFRSKCKDVIICDDARIYTTASFEEGMYPLYVPGGYQFAIDLYGDKVQLDLRETGYLIIDNR